MITAVGPQGERSDRILLEPLADGYLDGCRIRRHIWIDLHIVDPDRIGRYQTQSPNHAIPVGLGVIANAVRILAHANLDTVIHANGEAMPAGRQRAVRS